MTGLIGSVGELTPAQLATRSGVSVSALHFYERQGLIRSRRTPATNAAMRVRCCAGWRSSGFRNGSVSRLPRSAPLSTRCPRGGPPAARIGRDYRHSGAPIWISASSSSSDCVTIYPDASAAVVSRSIAVCCSIPMTCLASKVPGLASSLSRPNDAPASDDSPNHALVFTPATIVAINPVAGRGGGEPWASMTSAG